MGWGQCDGFRVPLQEESVVDLHVQHPQASGPLGLWQQVGKGLEKHELLGCGPWMLSHPGMIAVRTRNRRRINKGMEQAASCRKGLLAFELMQPHPHFAMESSITSGAGLHLEFVEG